MRASSANKPANKPANNPWSHFVTLTPEQREAARICGMSELDYARALVRLRRWKGLYRGWGLRKKGKHRLSCFSVNKRDCLIVKRSKKNPRKFEVIRVEIRFEQPQQDA